MTTITGNQTNTHIALPSLTSLGAKWNEFRTARRERNRIIRELNAYSDRDLAELGLFRHDVPAIAAGTYRR